MARARQVELLLAGAELHACRAASHVSPDDTVGTPSTSRLFLLYAHELCNRGSVSHVGSDSGHSD